MRTIEPEPTSSRTKPTGITWPALRHRGFTAYGVVTPAEYMPTGSASYTGQIAGEVWDGPSRTRNRRRMRSSNLTLNADFDQGSLDGTVTPLEASAPGTNTFAPLTGQSITITNGQITRSSFTADWQGNDPANNPTASVGDFSGEMEGDFYGPGAAEVAGVWEGSDSRSETVAGGVFGGGQQ